MIRNSRRLKYSSSPLKSKLGSNVAGSFNPNTLGKVLSCLIAVLIACNIFTLYLLNQTVHSASDCDDGSPKMKMQSMIENDHKQHIIKDNLHSSTVSQQTPKKRGNLPFVPIDPEIDRQNYQNPNPIVADSNKKGNSYQNPSASNSNSAAVSNSDTNTKQKEESSSSSSKKTMDTFSKDSGDNNNEVIIMNGNWEYNPSIPTRSEIIVINSQNQNIFRNNKYIESILETKGLWQDDNIESMNDDFCDWRPEYILNNTIDILSSLKNNDYMPMTICPPEVSVGWRANLYVPFIHGSACEPWWHRDAVFIMSRLLNKNMKALEYGSGASTIWMAQFVNYVIAIERLKTWADGLRNLSNHLNLDNIEIREFGLGRKYVEIEFDDNPGGMTDWMPNIDSNTGGIDFISVDGQLRYPCMEYAFKIIKPHGGIILLDNSDRPGNDGQNVTTIMPDHWLKFESSNLDRHIDRLKTKRWLENSQTTIYITRDKRCM